MASNWQLRHDFSHPLGFSIGHNSVFSEHTSGRSPNSLLRSESATTDDSIGGYDANFYPPLDKKLECPLCMFALRDPVQTTCGHRFCRSCIEACLKKAKPECPLDKNKLSNVDIYPDNWCKREVMTLSVSTLIYPDNWCKREVMTLSVRCDKDKDGCQWTGLLKDLEEHVKVKCDYRLVPCTNPGCKVLVNRARLPRHIESECEYRQVKCNWCHVLLPKQDLDKHCRFDCEKILVACPELHAGCSAMVPRGELERHLRENCTAVRLPCAYALEGCGWEGTRAEYRSHSAEQIHDHVEKAGLQLKAHQAEIKDVEAGLRRVQNEMLEMAQERESASIHTMQEKLMQMSTVLDKTTDRISGLYHRVEALESSETANAANRQRTGEHGRRIERLEMEIARLMSLVERIPAPGASPKSAPTAAEQFPSYGMLVWNINNFTQVRADAYSGRKLSIYSPAFYSTSEGYKMRVRLYPNGDGMGKGRYLSLFFTLVRGEYDDNLPWPFQHKVTFTLVDLTGTGQHIKESFFPDPNSSSFQKPRSDVNVASGCPLFVPLERLGEKSPFVMNNTIRIQVSVDTASHGY